MIFHGDWDAVKRSMDDPAMFHVLNVIDHPYTEELVEVSHTDRSTILFKNACIWEFSDELRLTTYNTSYSKNTHNDYIAGVSSKFGTLKTVSVYTKAFRVLKINEALAPYAIAAIVGLINLYLQNELD